MQIILVQYDIIYSFSRKLTMKRVVLKRSTLNHLGNLRGCRCRSNKGNPARQGKSILTFSQIDI